LQYIFLIKQEGPKEAHEEFLAREKIAVPNKTLYEAVEVE